MSKFSKKSIVIIALSVISLILGGTFFVIYQNKSGQNLASNSIQSSSSSQNSNFSTSSANSTNPNSPLEVWSQSERGVSSQSQSQNSANPSISSQSLSTLLTQDIKPIQNLTIKNSKSPEISSEGAPCQPDLFDPKTTKYEKIDGRYTIKVPNKDYSFGFQINGWDRENELKINLTVPFSVDFYTFGCASSFSHVLEIKKSGQRQYLFTHVLDFKFDESGKKLFLVNFVKNGDKWQKLSRIVNLETEGKFELSQNCGNYNVKWQGSKLLTTSDEKEGGKINTSVCLWNDKGELMKNYNVGMFWGTASRSFLNGSIGILAKNPDILYLTTFGYEDVNKCELSLIDTKNDRIRKITSTCNGSGTDIKNLIDLDNISTIDQQIQFPKK